MMAICWDHWCPKGWPRIFPFEIFLFFFLVFTGYLITGSLLRERDRNEERGGAWKASALKNYQIRRGLRILAPYYAAIALAWLVWAPDVHGAPWWYIFHLSNIHMAILGHWPPGTNHFWSLAMQQQFYLIWPLVLWFVPKRMILPVILLFTAVGPVTRYFDGFFSQWFAWPHVMTWANLDYFGIGGLLAFAVHRGMALTHTTLRVASVAGIVGYVWLFNAQRWELPQFGMWFLQQTFLSVALCGFIAAGTVGFKGAPGRFLEWSPLQRIGALSYGIYLFHNLAPMVTGKLFWFLWTDSFQGAGWEILKITLFAAVTWILTLCSWRWIEQPLQEVRAKISHRKSQT